LRPVQSPQQWTAYHAIRRDAIFAPLLPGQAYDEGDADEFKPGNLPHVLVCDGEVWARSWARCASTSSIELALAR
jgi:hypothetical protein